MARRGENIRYRKDGRWEARYFVTDPVTGKSKCRSLYAKTYAAAKQKRLDELSVYRADLSENVTSTAVSSPADSEGGTDGSANPLADAAQAWLGEVSESKKPSTYSKYKRIYESLLMPKISELSASDIAGWQEIDFREVMELSGKKLSDSVRRSIYGVMNHILEHYNAQYHTNIRLAKSIKKIHAKSRWNP